MGVVDVVSTVEVLFGVFVLGVSLSEETESSPLGNKSSVSSSSTVDAGFLILLLSNLGVCFGFLLRELSES